jgi:threonine aldolase
MAHHWNVGLLLDWAKEIMHEIHCDGTRLVQLKCTVSRLSQVVGSVAACVATGLTKLASQIVTEPICFN